MSTPQAPPGWYPDPVDGTPRHWDGTRWTHHRAPAAALGQDIRPSIGWGLWVVTLSGVAAIACSLASRIGIVRP